jgi:hypothetical protein
MGYKVLQGCEVALSDRSGVEENQSPALYTLWSQASPLEEMAATFEAREKSESQARPCSCGGLPSCSIEPGSCKGRMDPYKAVDAGNHASYHLKRMNP